MVSWLLPKRSDTSEAGIGDVPVLQRLLSSIPVVGGFWSSGQDLQECQLKVQTMERQLDMLRTDLKPTGILGRFLPDFVSGTEGGTIVPQMKGGNWLTVVLVGVIMSGNVLLWKFLSTDKEEKELEELGEIIQLMEEDIEFLDKEVENDREEDEEKKELRAEIQRLCNRVEALKKEREIETEKFSTELQDLQQTNDQLKDELSNKDASIGEYLNQLTKMEQINLEISEKLVNVEGEKADSIHRLESVLEGEIEELEKTIQNQLDIIKEMETEKEIETEKFSTELQDLQQTNDHLKDELSNKNASIGEYLNQLTKMEQINLEISEKLVNVEGEKAESIHRLESIFEGEIEELEKTIQNQLDIIKEMETEKERLEMKLTEAKEKDLVRNKNYNSLLEELVNLKEEYYEKSRDGRKKS
ncbi:chromosome partition protein Smc-like [Palaemon carinicauda]|uniref:chromosome partition protein Smc-like n=1 Tax=Palaemon carinicauda TaxID=392227 RepID=UPI0035B60142